MSYVLSLIASLLSKRSASSQKVGARINKISKDLIGLSVRSAVRKLIFGDDATADSEAMQFMRPAYGLIANQGIT